VRAQQYDSLENNQHLSDFDLAVLQYNAAKPRTWLVLAKDAGDAKLLLQRPMPAVPVAMAQEAASAADHFSPDVTHAAVRQ
jgi:hypothetical protein